MGYYQFKHWLGVGRAGTGRWALGARSLGAGSWARGRWALGARALGAGRAGVGRWARTFKIYLKFYFIVLKPNKFSKIYFFYFLYSSFHTENSKFVFQDTYVLFT